MKTLILVVAALILAAAEEEEGSIGQQVGASVQPQQVNGPQLVLEFTKCSNLVKDI